MPWSLIWQRQAGYEKVTKAKGVKEAAKAFCNLVRR